MKQYATLEESQQDGWDYDTQRSEFFKTYDSDKVYTPYSTLDELNLAIKIKYLKKINK